MATGFVVFVELRINTARAEQDITRTFNRMEGLEARLGARGERADARRSSKKARKGGGVGVGGAVTSAALLSQLTADNKATDKRIKKSEADRDSKRKKRRKKRRKAVGVAGLGIVGGIGAAAIAGARDTLAFQKTLDGVAIQAGASAEKMALFERALVATSRKTAISRQELALAAETLTNILGPAAIENTKLLDLVARTAVATGADISELGGLISAVSDTMGIAVTDTDQMEKALSAFVRTGKEGKIPLSEMAEVLRDVSGTFKRVGKGGVQSAAEVSAALQVLAQRSGSAAKAGTILESGIGQLVKKSAEFKKAGIDVFVGKGPEKRLRSLTEILDRISEKRLNIKQLQDILGRKEAVKFFELLTDPEARQTFDALSKSGQNASDIMVDFGKRTETQSFRIAKAMNAAKLAIGEAVTPARIETFVSILVAAVEAAAFLADGFVAVGTAIGEAVFDIEDAILGTREWQKQYAATLAEIRAIERALADVRERQREVTQERIAFEAELAVIAASKGDGQVTVEAIKQRLEESGDLPQRPDTGGLLAPLAVADVVIQAQREERVAQGLEGVIAALNRAAERDPEGTEAQVTLAPSAIAALNQRSFNRAQRDLPDLPGGTR